MRAYRGVQRHEERERASAQQVARELNYYHDEDGSLVIHARLPAEEGAVVLQALNAAIDAGKTEENEAEREDVTAVRLPQTSLAAASSIAARLWRWIRCAASPATAACYG